MKPSVKVTLITGGVIAVLLIAALVLAIVTRPSAPDAAEVGELPLTRADSHVLDAAGADKPTFVEFLDFECEVCGAFYPVMEQVRTVYEGEINYVVRYFPIPGHQNSMNAALAAEAAAQQGRFEDMYHRLFETQAKWGEQQVSHAATFRGYAEAMGLDMDAYDAAIADPATQQRVEVDRDEGLYAGVTGTPSFFLDGKKLELRQLSDLSDALNRATGR